MPAPDHLAARASAFKSSFRPPAISIPADAGGPEPEDLTTPSPTLVPQWTLVPGASGPCDVAGNPPPLSGTPPELRPAGVGSPAMTSLGPLWRYLEDCDNPRRKSTNLQVLGQQPDHVLTAYTSWVRDRADSLLATESMEYQRARVLRVMDFGPPSWEACGAWPLQVHYPPAATITSPADGASAQGQSQQSPTAVRDQRQQSEQEVEEEEQPLRTRLRGAKRKGGGSGGVLAGGRAGLPAELMAETGPAERHSSLDRHRVSAPALRTMR